jgi:hypothetical protein
MAVGFIAHFLDITAEFRRVTTYTAARQLNARTEMHPLHQLLIRRFAAESTNT